jgi:hypothetical protein
MAGNSIAGFPAPYEEELFYSTCARFAKIVDYPSGRMVVQQLFGTTNATAITDLPSYLAHFVGHLTSGYLYTVNRIISEQTLMPFYIPFLPPERVNALRYDMAAGTGMGIHMRAGIMASRIRQPEHLRLCPECVVADRNRYGECYWHRVHQVPGV